MFRLPTQAPAINKNEYEPSEERNRNYETQNIRLNCQLPLISTFFFPGGPSAPPTQALAKLGDSSKGAQAKLLWSLDMAVRMSRRDEWTSMKLNPRSTV